MSNSLCGGASLGGSRSLSKILLRASHRAVVTGEWYIPGHRAMGFRSPELSAGGGLSDGAVAVANVEATGIVPFTAIVLLEGEEFKSIGFFSVLGDSFFNFSLLLQEEIQSYWWLLVSSNINVSEILMF